MLTTTKQVGDIRARWAWVKPEVWTDRMLTALENGVKGGCWYSLMDKVAALANLRVAFEEVKANGGAAGADHQTIEVFETKLETNLERLAQQLRDGSYRPAAIRRVWIDKPGSREKRPLGIPTVRDRVAQAAVRHVIEPIFEREFAPNSYGFRPQRGCRDALRRVDALLKAGHIWVVDADFRSYFDTIPHQPLLKRIEEHITDSRVMDLIDAYLKADVMETAQTWQPTTGTPQGAVLSPLLANIYLNPLDHLVAQQGFEMVRYADDLVILCGSQSQAQQALNLLREWTTQAGLTLHPDKTRLVDASQRGGFDFLGYHFERGYRWPSRKSLRKFKANLRAKTKRTPGHSLTSIVSEINRTIQGWFAYFKHSHKTTFPRLDSWIRMRLRSILRKNQGRKGHGYGHEHFRWPNAFFAQLGLFSLVTAHAEARQSPTG